MRDLMMAVLSVSLSACQTAPRDGPARLDIGKPGTREALHRDLGAILGRAEVELGPEDLSVSTSISVLPPRPGRYETRSLARPEVFDLVIRNGACVAVRRRTGTAYPLDDVRCVPAGPG